jgi:RNA-directed DNA polymerase
MQHPDGTLQQQDRGTPQGSAVSPVLANLFLHYAFDAWMGRVFPAVPFERYADDGVVHCVSRRQAQYARRAIGDRMAQVGLRLHPDKTRVVYCKDGSRRGSWEHVLHVPGVCVPGRRSPWSSGGTCSPRSSRRSARRP